VYRFLKYFDCYGLNQRWTRIPRGLLILTSDTQLSTLHPPHECRSTLTRSSDLAPCFFLKSRKNLIVSPDGVPLQLELED
jgi:hypothetical protein